MGPTKKPNAKFHQDLQVVRLPDHHLAVWQSFHKMTPIYGFLREFHLKQKSQNKLWRIACFFVCEFLGHPVSSLVGHCVMLCLSKFTPGLSICIGSNNHTIVSIVILSAFGCGWNLVNSSQTIRVGILNGIQSVVIRIGCMYGIFTYVWPGWNLWQM